jgi:hypothetical protein
VRVQAAHLRVERDPAEDLDPGLSDPVLAQRRDVHRRVVVMRLDDNRSHSCVGGALRGLRRIHPPGERRRVRVDMEVDGPVEEAFDDVSRH